MSCVLSVQVHTKHYGQPLHRNSPFGAERASGKCAKTEQSLCNPNRRQDDKVTARLQRRRGSLPTAVTPTLNSHVLACEKMRARGTRRVAAAGKKPLVGLGLDQRQCPTSVRAPMLRRNSQARRDRMVMAAWLKQVPAALIVGTVFNETAPRKIALPRRG